MAGRGFLEEAPDIDFENIKVLKNGRWHKCFRPVHYDRKTAGFCLAESFAEKYAKVHNVEVGLIPCADGGTSLNQWKEGSLLYDNAVNNARLAMRTSHIVGILWHQGESDCAQELYPAYKEHFEKMISALKKELNLDVPVIVGGLGDFLPYCTLSKKLKNYHYINKALEEFAKENEKAGFVSAKGLTSNPDQLHFNAKSLYEFGLRYFEEFEKLREDRVYEELPAVDDAIRTQMELL